MLISNLPLSETPVRETGSLSASRLSLGDTMRHEF
jgi:hypothetical protein